MVSHCSILGWRTPWTEEPGGLQSIGLHRVGHDFACYGRAAPTATCTVSQANSVGRISPRQPGAHLAEGRVRLEMPQGQKECGWHLGAERDLSPTATGMSACVSWVAESSAVLHRYKIRAANTVT